MLEMSAKVPGVQGELRHSVVQHPQSNLECVEWDVKHFLTQTIASTVWGLQSVCAYSVAK